MDQLGPVSTAMIERLDIADDQDHLDIAAGTGEPGHRRQAPPRGHVVLTDLAVEMLGAATRRAKRAGITNFETKVCSADALPFGTPFDSISVRFGYMFFPDSPKRPPSSRAAQARRTSRSSVWTNRRGTRGRRSPCGQSRPRVAPAPADPDRPNMFQCAAPGYVSALYEAAGLRSVAEWDVDVELVAAIACANTYGR